MHTVGQPGGQPSIGQTVTGTITHDAFGLTVNTTGSAILFRFSD